jgi:hypothetical protein
VLIALDGTEYFCSKTILCPNCSTRLRGKAGKENFQCHAGGDPGCSRSRQGCAAPTGIHRAALPELLNAAAWQSRQGEFPMPCWGATLVAPGHDKVVPLQPEFIVPQDGAEKQDRENAAVKRWLVADAAGYERLNPIYLGDDLFSRQPECEAVLAAGSHSSSSASRHRIL